MKHKPTTISKRWIILFLIIGFSKPSLLVGQQIGISKADFMSHYKAQQTVMWCWASCAEMVLSFEGINFPQEAIVTKVKGAPVVQGGNPYEMINSTNTIINDLNGKPTVVSGQFIQGAPIVTVLFNQLKHRRPIILTYSSGAWSGHAVVLTGIDYVLNPDNTLLINKYYVFDPFSYTQTYDIMGRPYFTEDLSKRYKEYNLQMSAWGLQLLDGNNPVGIVTGVILIDASEL